MNKEKVSVIAVLANLVLAFLKITTGSLGRSSAVLAEGLHSAVDIVSSGLSFLGIRAANKPADKEHPYGHFKFELLSGLAITVILFLTGLWIFYESYKGFVNPKPAEMGYLPLAVMAFSAIINEIMARVKIHYGKKEQSLSLISDGMHSRVDAISSLAIFAGLFLTPFSPYFDPLLTFLVGAYILKKSFDLGKEAAGSLMDVSAGEEIELKIKDIARDRKIEISDIKTQKKGSAITASIFISLPKSLSVEEANTITSDLHKRLHAQIVNLRYIAIQIRSHDIEHSYYHPASIIPGMKNRQGFGWQRKGRFAGKAPDANGNGPGGDCICAKCGYKTEHQKGVPCSTIKCPECGDLMTRS